MYSSVHSVLIWHTETVCKSAPSLTDKLALIPLASPPS